MVRSMYSGVSGMRAHQTRMDAIGNNVSNVNTYGYKSSRATFRDVYYQATRGAAAPSATKGGINPSAVGYGAQSGSIDKLMTQSTFMSTGYPYDVAIDGEGFFQVQDSTGMIYYTRAGMLTIDSSGNVTDSNGNKVLGATGNPLGQPAGKTPIKISLNPIQPKQAAATQTINNANITIRASNTTKEGNVGISFISDSSLAVGETMKATVTASGTITVKVNPTAKFTDMSAFQTAVNAAITTANGGTPHPAGNFVIEAPSADFTKGGTSTDGLTGDEIVGFATGMKPGTANLSQVQKDAGFGFVEVGTNFLLDNAANTAAMSSGAITWAKNAATNSITITYTVTGANPAATYSNDVPLTADNLKNGGKVLLKRNVAGGGAAADPDDYITLSVPSFETLNNATTLSLAGDANMEVKASTPSYDVGLGKETFTLTGGNEGGEQTMNDVTNVSIGMDGIISLFDANGEYQEVGRLDLVTFANPEGLMQSGNTYFTATNNSGEPRMVKPGEDGAGGTKSAMLEQSNVDLSQEFSDMIVTQRGFQANSRLITVSDTMLEELVNLKR